MTYLLDMPCYFLGKATVFDRPLSPNVEGMAKHGNLASTPWPDGWSGDALT